MSNEKMPIEQQISKLIKSSKCTFKTHSDRLNVIGVNKVSILNYKGGEFGEWNTKYSGNAELTVVDCEVNNRSALYNIEGYAMIKADAAVDIDKTISVSCR